MPAAVHCNVCGNDEFVDIKQRKNVRCKKCGSLERTRLLWMYLQKAGLHSGQSILHIAPERGLSNAIANVVGHEGYVMADIEPDKYRHSDRIAYIDLCDLDDQPTGAFDLIVHSHVLEHVTCNIAYTLFHLHRMLKADGKHICVIPIMSGKYDESFQDLSNEERHQRFGQFNHVRRIGRDDLGMHLGKLLRLPERFDAASDFSPAQLTEANVPEALWRGFHTSSVLVLSRNDMVFIHC